MFFDPAIIALAQQCSPNVDAHTMAVLVQTESSGNPFNIGIVGSSLAVPPKSKTEAVTVAQSLIDSGANISVGLGQINMHNWQALGLTLDSAFDSCANLKGAGSILTNCYTRAVEESGEGQGALQQALSCYYSNNFTRGFVNEGGKKGSYVFRIAKNNEKLLNVPRIEFKPEDVPEKGNTVPSEPAAPKPAIHALENLSIPTEEKTESWDVFKDFSQQ